eukprot:tig00021366_g20849.t1
MNRFYVAALLVQLAPLGPTLHSLSLRLCPCLPSAFADDSRWDELGAALAPFSALRRLHIYAVPRLGDEELRAVGAALPSLRELGTWCEGDTHRVDVGTRTPAQLQEERDQKARHRLERLREFIPSLESAPLDHTFE